MRLVNYHDDVVDDDDDEVGNYRLTVAGYSGDAGDALAAAAWSLITSDGYQFSSPDIDNDVWAGGCCAADEHAGWWFGECSASNLNKDAAAIWTAESVTVWDVTTARMLVKLN